jgi:hypothetical protein
MLCATTIAPALISITAGVFRDARERPCPGAGQGSQGTSGILAEPWVTGSLSPLPAATSSRQCAAQLRPRRASEMRDVMIRYTIHALRSAPVGGRFHPRQPDRGWRRLRPHRLTALAVQAKTRERPPTFAKVMRAARDNRTTAHHVRSPPARSRALANSPLNSFAATRPGHLRVVRDSATVSDVPRPPARTGRW